MTTKFDKVLVTLVVIAFIAFSGLATFTIARVQSLTDRVGHNQATNTLALCAVRHDEQVRIDQSYAFLVTHPHGIAGISRAAILSGVANEQRTVRALSIVKCL